MAKKTTALTEDTAPLATDIIATVDDPGGTPASKKSLISNIVGYMVTTAGDIVYATGSRVLARLGIGTAKQRLLVNAGATAPEWADQAITYFEMVVFGFTTDVSTGDGKFYFHIPAGLDGMDLVEVHAEVITAGTTGTTDIQIRNVTQAADMLSTKITIDSGETGSDTAATPPVIDTGNDDVTENDLIAVDVDAVSTTAPKGLIVTAGFNFP